MKKILSIVMTALVFFTGAVNSIFAKDTSGQKGKKITRSGDADFKVDKLEQLEGKEISLDNPTVEASSELRKKKVSGDTLKIDDLETRDWKR